MKRKTLTTRRGLSLILAAALAAAWLLGSAAMTLITADYFRDVMRIQQMQDSEYYTYLDWMREDTYLYSLRVKPGYDQHQLLSKLAVNRPRHSIGKLYTLDSQLWEDLRLGYEMDVTYVHQDGQTFGRGGYIYGRFVTEEELETDAGSLERLLHEGWIDLTDLDPAVLETLDRRDNETNRSSEYNIYGLTYDLLRIRGTVDQYGQIIPRSMDWVSSLEAAKKLRESGKGSLLHELRYDKALEEGWLDWTPLLTGEGGEVTLYLSQLDLIVPARHKPVPAEKQTDSLWKLVTVRQQEYRDYTDYKQNDPLPPSIISVTVAARSYPMWEAVKALKWGYLLLALLLAGVWCLIREQLVKYAADPLERMVRAIDRNGAPDWIDFDFAEVHAVNRGLIALQDQRLALENEITRLQKALDYAEEAELQRRRTTNALAHELKTPLAVVHSYAEGLQLGIAGEKTPAYIQTILKESEKMDGLVMEMLDLSRLEAGKITIARDNFDLGAVTKDIFDKMAPLAEKKNLSVELAMEGDFPVVADETRIRQAVENYASNAMKYTPEGGRITATLSRHSGSLRLTVENTCPPLSKEALERVWEPFYRADAARTTPGTGLGLAITATVIQLHRGKVGVENTPDGVKFWFSLPI